MWFEKSLKTNKSINKIYKIILLNDKEKKQLKSASLQFNWFQWIVEIHVDWIKIKHNLLLNVCCPHIQIDFTTCSKSGAFYTCVKAKILCLFQQMYFDFAQTDQFVCRTFTSEWQFSWMDHMRKPWLSFLTRIVCNRHFVLLWSFVIPSS